MIENSFSHRKTKKKKKPSNFFGMEIIVKLGKI
jgi:hypothetical protein